MKEFYRELLQDAILEEVAEEVSRESKWRGLAPIIVELKDNKKFTYRMISEWLEAKGVKASSSSVYQAYRNYSEEVK